MKVLQCLPEALSDWKTLNARFPRAFCARGSLFRRKKLTRNALNILSRTQDLDKTLFTQDHLNSGKIPRAAPRAFVVHSMISHPIRDSNPEVCWLSRTTRRLPAATPSISTTLPSGNSTSTSA